MKPRPAVDPQLHLIRSIARSAVRDSRSRGDLESARFALYAAFETCDPELAAQWSRSLRVALRTVELDAESRDLALEALDEIDVAIGTDE